MASEDSMHLAAGGRAAFSRKQKLISLVGTAVIALTLSSVFYLARNSIANADVGACVKEAGQKGLEKVDCGSPEARYQIVGKVTNKSQAEATFTTCKESKRTSDIYWARAGGQSFVLCLAAVPK